MICATASGCVTYGSPDLRVWPSWACGGELVRAADHGQVRGGIVAGDFGEDLIELMHHDAR